MATARKSTRQRPDDAVEPGSLEAWRRWLAAHHGREAGIWVVSLKKSAGGPRVSYDELVTEALCWGWIDSKPRALDADRSMLWFAPRRAGSGWSLLNKQRLQRAVAAGRLQPPGRAKIEAAKADGSWQALDEVDALVVPADLAAALAARPPADANFAAFPPSARRGILEWIAGAKTPDTRTRRVGDTARLAASNERANQWRPAARAPRKR